MLKGFEESIKDMDLTDEIRALLIKNADTLSTGLSDKNTELINKNKLITDQTTSEKALSDAAKEELDTLRNFKTTADLEAEEAGKNYDAAKLLTEEAHQKALDLITESSTKLLEEATSKSSGYESELKEIRVDQAITKELVKLEVKKELIEMAHASIAQQTTFVDGKAMIGEKSLSEYMIEWGDSPAGKASRLAPNNNGGGSNGDGDNNDTDKSKEVKTSDERADDINKRFKKL